jgi:transforming growth factor-beta-induced protein
MAAKLQLSKVQAAILVGTLILAPGGCARKTVMPPPEKAKDIVDTAVAAGSFKTLAKALEAAGLVETLKGEGPFTVFAPNDQAFAKLPEDALEDLLKPENKEKLKAILTYHVVAGELMAADVAKMTSAKTVQGQELAVKVQDDTVMVGDAKVIQTDIGCSNGVIHIIDSVLMPPEAK